MNASPRGPGLEPAARAVQPRPATRWAWLTGPGLRARLQRFFAAWLLLEVVAVSIKWGFDGHLDPSANFPDVLQDLSTAQRWMLGVGVAPLLETLLLQALPYAAMRALLRWRARKLAARAGDLPAAAADAVPQHRAKPAAPPLRAVAAFVVLTSVAFGALHPYSVPYQIATTAMGAVFASYLALEARQSLRSAFIWTAALHAVHNLLAAMGW